MNQIILKHSEITETILHTFYKRVYPALGYGFLERIYNNAMVIELQNEGLKVEAESPIQVYYAGNLIGEYFADLLVEDKVIVELFSKVRKSQFFFHRNLTFHFHVIEVYIVTFVKN